MISARVRPASLLRRGLQVAAFNTLIALGLTLAEGGSFGTHLLYSQLIGLSIWSCIDVAQAVLIRDWPTQWRRIVAIAPLGGVLGFTGGLALADLLLGRAPLVDWSSQPRQGIALLLLSLAAGTVATYFYASREQASQAHARAEALQREAVEARLRLLEAQLDPHMLFNTLANLRALITLDAPRAQEMLDRLVAYLRATLAGSRVAMHPLSSEFQRLDDYLSLMAVRMGPRLSRELRLPPDLAQLGVPALLLQPLVENSIVHGLEPKPEGGHLRISARREGRSLLLEVMDTGVGLGTDSPGTGFGLQHVRERLQTLHGTLASLAIEACPQGGTRATIRLPLEP